VSRPMSGLSLVIPAYNEAAAIGQVLDEARAALEGLGIPWEIIVVDDCSQDDTAALAEATGVTVLRNIQNGGYGYALMRGIRQARFGAVAIIDADGSYPVSALPHLVDGYRRGSAMVVAHRQGEHYAGSRRLRLMRWLFRMLAQFIVGRSVPDVNSGLRVFERDRVLPLLPYMSYGFSFTTSISLLFMLLALPVSYVPVEYRERSGTSKVRYLRDGLRALQIVASVTVRLNPIKIFLLGAVLNLLLLGPVAALGALWPGGLVAAALVVEVSVLLVALGLVMEGLSDKTEFARGGQEVPGGRRPGPAD